MGIWWNRGCERVPIYRLGGVEHINPYIALQGTLTAPITARPLPGYGKKCMVAIRVKRALVLGMSVMRLFPF